MIESFVPEPVKVIVTGIIALVIVLSALSCKLPNVAWLQAFHLQDNRTEEQKRRSQRSANLLGGAEMIMLGIAAPLVYFVGTVMFFNEITTGAMLVVGAISILFIGLGVSVMVKAARPDR